MSYKSVCTGCEAFLLYNGSTTVHENDCPILAKEKEVSPMKMTIHHPPKGYEAEGVWRVLQTNEYYVNGDGEVEQWTRDYCSISCHIVLTPERFRAEQGKYYFIISNIGEIYKRMECDLGKDRLLYNLGNYYRTREQAEAVSVKVKAAYLEGQNGSCKC